MTRELFLSVSCAAVVFVALAGSAVEPTESPNLLLVSIDTLRADRIFPIGDRVETPAAKRLAEDGFSFTQCVTNNTVTLPSHATIMTGLMPHEHHVHDNGGFRLESGAVTLAEIVSERGYRTAAFVSAFVLDDCFGLDQGFGLYDDDFSTGFSSQRDRQDPDTIEHSTLAWRLMGVPETATRLKISARHAAGGELGTFEYILAHDEDGDKDPDCYLQRSRLYEGPEGDWSWHIFDLDSVPDGNLYVGITWPGREKKRVPYAQDIGTFDRWVGMEPQVWRAGTYGDVPGKRSYQPCAADLRVTYLNERDETVGRAGLTGDTLNAVNGGQFWQGMRFVNFERRAADTIDRALQWLDEAQEPWFVWVHLFDPHMVYDPPKPYRHIYSDPYDGEVAYADAQTMRLLRWLDERAAYERTAIVYVSDHGESLGEHNHWGHGTDLYEPGLRVPMLIKPPHYRGAVQVDEMVELLALAPTCLAMVEETPPPQMSAQPLLVAKGGGKWFAGREGFPEVSFAETYRYERPYRGGVMLGFRTPRWKVIKVPRDNERQFFDLQNDPGETHPLADAPAEGLPEDLTTAEERTNELLDVGRNEPDIEGLTAEQIERLQGLGYY